jgi:hypothetical protein
MATVPWTVPCEVMLSRANSVIHIRLVWTRALPTTLVFVIMVGDSHNSFAMYSWRRALARLFAALYIA